MIGIEHRSESNRINPNPDAKNYRQAEHTLQRRDLS
jgi:hypothetical protein